MGIESPLSQKCELDRNLVTELTELPNGFRYHPSHIFSI